MKFVVLVLTASLTACGFPPCGGFQHESFRCLDVSPRMHNFPVTPGSSVSSMTLSLAISADGDRLYAGAFSGVWRSDDGGETWIQIVHTQPGRTANDVPGALPVSTIFDLAVSPVNADVVLAGTGRSPQVPSRDGIYRSVDGGRSWTLVHQFRCGGTTQFAGQIVFAPDDPRIVYAAGNCAIAVSTDAGASWRETAINGSAWHIAIAPKEDSRRRVYALGDNQLWYSEDGLSFVRDGGTGALPLDFGQRHEIWTANSARILAIEPGRLDHVYLAMPHDANGPSYYHPRENGPDGTTRCNSATRRCGEGSIWLGDFSSFAGGGRATWTQLPGPPAYYGGSTDGGNVYVMTQPTSSGYLLFFSDRSHVHVSQGRPISAASWHRLDGPNASQSDCDGCRGNSAGCNVLFTYADPHALAYTRDFEITLKPAECAGLPSKSPYDQNAILGLFRGGTIWMANDGGVYRSTDGGRTWTLGDGLATLQPQTAFAGVSLPQREPALYFGVPHNHSFFSVDGAETWHRATGCGDCSAWFSDPIITDRVLELDRGGGWNLHSSPGPGQYPVVRTDARQQIPMPEGAVNQIAAAEKHSSPIIPTNLGDASAADGDYVVIRVKDGKRGLLRTQSVSQIRTAADWETKAEQAGPDFLPEMHGADIVQASGGHRDPAYYVGDTQSLWTWRAGLPGWQRIVPAANLTAFVAKRFFVDPYDARRIYIIDRDAIRRSEDGGQTWLDDAKLSHRVTESGSFPYQADPNGATESWVINDMVFDWHERNTRFAVGTAGVFMTLDGHDWLRLASSTALPGRPRAAYFHRAADPDDRSLYVGLFGRGIIRLRPIPR